MVCGGKLICDARNTTVLANPDVAGYGVLVSFILSALLTVGAVLYAYLSDSMPKKYLSDTDKAFIRDFQRLEKKLPFRHLLSKLRSTRIEPQRKLTREQREEAVNRFVLSLSDQQLATGLAILIAAIANQCTLSPPEFRIAFSLAWFSTTTHLATLDSLRQYFTKHKTLRNVRVFGMLAFMVLFLYCFILVLLMENSPDNISPVQCHLQGSVRTYKDEEVTLSNYFWPWTMTVLIIMFAYKSKLLRTYSYGSNDFIGLGRYSKNVLSLWSRWRYPKEMQLPSIKAEEWNYVRKEAAMELFARHRQRLLMDIMGKSKDAAFATELVSAWRYAEHRYWHSMLPLVPPMVFMLVFGFAQMILFRWELGDFEAIEVDTSMGFGQIIPLILIALPFLAAAEIYYESKSPPLLNTRFNTVNFSEPNSAVSPAGVNRSSSLRVTSSADVSDPILIKLEEKGREYDKKTSDVHKYFLEEAKEVGIEIAKAKTDQEIRAILIRKEQLLKDTKICLEAENKMKDKGFPLILASLLCMRVLLFAAAAILLNLPRRHFVGGTVGAALLVVQLGLQLYGWVATLRRTEVKAYVRLLSEFSAKNRP